MTDAKNSTCNSPRPASARSHRSHRVRHLNPDDSRESDINTDDSVDISEESNEEREQEEKKAIAE